MGGETLFMYAFSRTMQCFAQVLAWDSMHTSDVVDFVVCQSFIPFFFSKFDAFFLFIVYLIYSFPFSCTQDQALM